MIINQACAFVGHQTYELPWGHDEGSTQCVHVKELLKQKISQRVDNGCHTFYTSALPGAGMICAETVLELRDTNPIITLSIVPPPRALIDKWDERSRIRYFDILERADSEILLIGFRGKDRIRERHRWMISNAGYLIAIYNGKDKLGDTRQAIKMARIKARNITTINPLDLKVENTFFEGEAFFAPAKQRVPE